MKLFFTFAVWMSFSAFANAGSNFCENTDSIAQDAIRTVQFPLDSLLLNSGRDYTSCMFAAGQTSGAVNVSFNLLSERNSHGCYKDGRVVRDALNSIEQIKQALTILCSEKDSQAMLIAVSKLRVNLSSIH